MIPTGIKIRDVRVGQKDYSIIELQDDNFSEFLSSIGEISNVALNAKAFIVYDQQIICVRAGLHPQTRDESIVHEIMHAMLEESGHSETIDAEKFISILAPQLMSCFELK